MTVIDSASIYRYKLRLTTPIAWAGQARTHRSGLLVCLGHSDYSGWGDIAPLPGFSAESLAEAQAWAEVFAREILESPLRTSDLSAIKIPPSVRFGFELALCNLDTTTRKQSLQEASAVACCGLIGHQEDQQTHLAHSLVSSDYRAAKLKLGRQTVEEDLNTVHTICGKYPELKVRVDANRSWSINTAKKFVRATQNLRLDYLEEPLNDKTELMELARNCTIPIALDETLRERDAEKYHKFADVRVLKPTLAGGIYTTFTHIEQAIQDNARCIISSSYESGVGMLGLIELARKLPKEIHGLDTQKVFERDVFRVPLQLSGPMLLPEGSIETHDLDQSILHRVWHAKT
ncbi:MAG: o-succinylbenzoate synthase [Rhodothermaceae bacterium]|nr:o-succinylbenzoate synthase [Rhodothermaceae bacterium]MXX59126.1 o-succinylbenzoate synthase [Rhodothermaceae bacterium]MYD19482.1 o-succinylbenzoate synthase [Rhodothermaceae bacterium]MYD57149.1 o-succinylbenzoate synthase [Rhodothermaceae bacterium]MYI44283.1 o-succinylbenzoate synthase [Rhodothermaceae bacterium]